MEHKTFLFICLLYVGWLPVGILDKSELKCVTGSSHVNQSTEINKSRQKRFLTFNNEEGVMKIELNFNIPFVQIPIGGKHTRMANDRSDTHPVVDVNAKSLITAGAFVFTVLFVIPKLLKLILPQSTRFSKAETDTEFGRLIHDAEVIMSAMNIDVDSCWRRTVCSTIQLSSRKVNERKGSSWDKIIDGVARNDLLHFMIHGSSTYEGVMSGLADDHCTSVYKKCNLNIMDAISIMRKVST